MGTEPQAFQWIESVVEDERSERIRLFCFPHAGGGARMYREWSKFFPPEIRLVPILLPGRESRILEPSIADLGRLLAQLSQAIRPVLDIPFAFFGHSMGAMIAWELARSLRDSGGISPSHLFVSGSRALPSLGSGRTSVRSMTDAELIGELKKMGGTEQEILNDPDLMDMLMPCIRADYTLVDDYVYRPGTPLACPATVLGGDRDPEVPADELGNWAELTTGNVEVRVYPGGHFFLRDHAAEIAGMITERMGIRENV